MNSQTDLVLAIADDPSAAGAADASAGYPWTASTSALPPSGESVEFFVQGRATALEGHFVDALFRSRWSSYPVERVSAWRNSASTMSESLSPQVVAHAAA